MPIPTVSSPSEFIADLEARLALLEQQHFAGMARLDTTQTEFVEIKNMVKEHEEDDLSHGGGSAEMGMTHGDLGDQEDIEVFGGAGSVVTGACALKGGYASTDSILGANVDITWNSSIKRSAIATVDEAAGTITTVKAGLYLCFVCGNVKYDLPASASPTLARIVLRRNGSNVAAAAGGETNSVKALQSGLLDFWISGVELLELSIGDVITARFNGRKDGVHPSATTPSVSNAQLIVAWYGV